MSERRRFPWWSKLLIASVVIILIVVVAWRGFESALKSECREAIARARAGTPAPVPTGDASLLDRWISARKELVAAHADRTIEGLPILGDYGDEDEVLPPDGSRPEETTIEITTRFLRTNADVVATFHELLDALPIVHPTRSETGELDFRFGDVKRAAFSLLLLELFHAGWTEQPSRVNATVRFMLQLRSLRPEESSWFHALTSFGTDIEVANALKVALPHLDLATLDRTIEELSRLPVTLSDAWSGERRTIATNLERTLEAIPNEDLVFYELDGPLGEIRYYRAFLQILRFIEEVLPELDRWEEIDTRDLREKYAPSGWTRWLELDYSFGSPIEIGIGVLINAQQHRQKVRTALVALQWRRETLRRGAPPGSLADLKPQIPPSLLAPGDDLGLTVSRVAGGLVLCATPVTPDRETPIGECYEEPGWFPIRD